MEHRQLIVCLCLGLLLWVFSDPSVAATDMVAHYKLDETSGTVATDSSGYGNDGTYTNSPTLGTAGPYPGDIATAVDFDGSNDHVALGNLNVSGSQITIAAWFKADSFPGTASRIVAKANGSGLSDNYWSLTSYSSGGSNFLGILLKTDSGGTVFIPSSTEALEIGEWTHVAAVYNGSTLKLYKNGVEILSSAVTGNITSGPTVPVWIAGSPSNEKYFDGRIDDVRIYSKSLSAEEVAELYGLVDHWKMDEGAGTTAADATAFGNDSTLAGATWTTDCAGKGALVFDGVADTAATNVAFDPPATGTVAFWMQAAGTPAVRQRIFGLNGNWEARIETNGNISFDLGASPYYGNEPFAAFDIVDQDRWYHIVASFNDVDDSYAVYVNGELQASGTSPVNLVPQSPGILSFGTRTGSGENWKGSLRDFRVYNRWLANSEISTLSGLAGYWKLDETSGTVAVDSSPNGNNGTYTNGVLLNQPGNVNQAADF
ncbi:MAG: LamG domain-containing protein, partial [Planctomycetes bacterium]|nr:LamG domain-containing protein [Planctomycetota bacterium]